MEIIELSKQLLIFSAINSFVIFGLMSTIRKIANKEDIHRLVGIILTYAIAILMGFMFSGIDVTWKKVVWGVFLGNTSIAVYKSATQSLLEIIPNIVKKFMWFYFFLHIQRSWATPTQRWGLPASMKLGLPFVSNEPELIFPQAWNPTVPAVSSINFFFKFIAALTSLSWVVPQ